MRVLFEKSRSFFDDKNVKVPRASETPWSWLLLALPHWPNTKLAVLLACVDDEHIPGCSDILLISPEPPRVEFDSCWQPSLNNMPRNVPRS